MVRKTVASLKKVEKFLNDNPEATSKDVAEFFGVGERTAQNYLKKLGRSKPQGRRPWRCVKVSLKPKMELKRLIVFAILMEHGKGILAKSPGFIKEKYNLAKSAPYPEKLLNLDNYHKYRNYLDKFITGGCEENEDG